MTSTERFFLVRLWSEICQSFSEKSCRKFQIRKTKRKSKGNLRICEDEDPENECDIIMFVCFAWNFGAAARIVDRDKSISWSYQSCLDVRG